jgi:hypothetical protein
MTNGRVQTMSFSLPKDLIDRLKQRLPIYGDRSRVVVSLLEQFLNGKVIAKIPERRL